MTRLGVSLAIVIAGLPFVYAGISFTSPKAGSKLVAGNAMKVAWTDGGTGPKLADLTTYELFLCAGGNAPADQIVVLSITTQGSFTEGHQIQGLVGPSVGDNTPNNAYFLKIVAAAKAGGQLIEYSDRFSYSGMTGVFPDSIKMGLEGILGTAGPATVDNTNDPAKRAVNPAVNPAAGVFGTPYNMQSGPIRYAPMQPVPGTKITARNISPLFPSSSVVVATTFLPSPIVQTTSTQSETNVVKSRVNMAAPASHPGDDMHRFLNRWKD